MKRFLLLILGFVFIQSVFGQMDSLFKKGPLLNAGYSVYAIDAETGNLLYSTPQVSLVPASVMKLITTATALEILGPDFRFHTQIGFTGKIISETGILKGDLVLKGGCDPAFYSEYFAEHYQGTFEAWAKVILKRGVKVIEGNLVVDLAQLSGQPVPGGWLWEDIGNYYGAGVSALTYSDNCYSIHLKSSESSGQPTIINYFSPDIDSLKLVNRVVCSEINHDLTIIYGAPGSNSQVIEGSIPKGRTDFVVKGAMPDPALVCAAEFKKVLESVGLKMTGKVIVVNKLNPGGFELLADKPSPPLNELIIPLNHESINLFAEHLLREIGRKVKGSATLTESLEAVKDFWNEKKIFIEGFYPTDGSGLSRSNGVCSRTLAEVIRFMYLSPNRDNFFKSLPLAGRRGTLQFAFKGTKLENNLQAKTGSMTRVRSLAGIFTNRKDKKVIFAVMTNNFEGTQLTMGHTIEAILSELYLADIPVSDKN